MKLTREQIERMAEAARAEQNGAVFYVEEKSDGKLRFGAIEIVEKQKPISLSKVAVKA